MTDTRDGHLYRDGAERVTVRGVAGFRTRTFKGETAWSDAERYANDALWAARRQHGGAAMPTTPEPVRTFDDDRARAELVALTTYLAAEDDWSGADVCDMVADMLVRLELGRVDDAGMFAATKLAATLAGGE